MAPSINPDLKLWVLLQQARDLAYKAAEKELRRSGLTYPEAMLIFIVDCIGEEATQAEIARWMFRETHSVAALINRMEARGLVRRSRDLDSKLLVRISVTEKARQFCKVYPEMKSIDMILSCLSEEERKQLGASLEKLRNRALDVMRVERVVPFPGP